MATPTSHPAMPQASATAQTTPVRGGDVLACGFGMTVAAWTVAYISRIPMLNPPGDPVSGRMTVGLMLAAIFVGGIVTARYSPRGVLGALYAGLLSGLLNILLVGSVLHDVSQGQSVAPAAGLWIGGSIVLNAAVALAGGLIGMAFPAPSRQSIRWTSVLALVLAAATLPLITAGGLVTAFRVGLAVPDWPQSYGYNMFLFPLSQMQADHGNFYEHSHRLMGSLVGLTSLALAIHVTIAQRGAGIKWFGWMVFVSVCVQGIIGGTRVTDESLALALVHGIFAQVVLAAMVALAAITGGRTARGEAVLHPGAGGGRALSVVLLVAVSIQLVLGALVRHYHLDSILVLHIVMAAFVAPFALVCGFRACALHSELPELKWGGIALMAFVGVQLLLGIMALVYRAARDAEPSSISALWTTAHQANGAVLLAACAMLAAWSWSLLVSPPDSQDKEYPSPVSDAAGEELLGQA